MILWRLDVILTQDDLGLTQEDECLVEEAMQAVHAQELGNRDFNAISDGQKQQRSAGESNLSGPGCDRFR